MMENLTMFCAIAPLVQTVKDARFVSLKSKYKKYDCLTSYSNYDISNLFSIFLYLQDDNIKRANAEGIVKPRFECSVHGEYKTYRKY